MLFCRCMKRIQGTKAANPLESQGKQQRVFSVLEFLFQVKFVLFVFFHVWFLVVVLVKALIGLSSFFVLLRMSQVSSGQSFLFVSVKGYISVAH